MLKIFFMVEWGCGRKKELLINQQRKRDVCLK